MIGNESYQTLSITSPGPATLAQSGRHQVVPRNPCDISDIDGASAQPKYKLYANKPIFLNSDIPGAQPKQLIRGRNVRDNSLYIDDIEGTRRTIKDRMMRTTRRVNPLEPDYPLPSYVPVDSAPVPFMRDSMNISDIEGTKPRLKKEFAPKNTMYIADIEGSKPGLRETNLLNSIKTRNILETEDVSKNTHRFVDRVTRDSDPCAPVYRVHGMEIKDGKECKPRSLPKYMAGNHLLQTKDITGATSDTRYASPFPRREYRNTNFIGDIEGSHADSIKHSIRTNRTTHPLQPVYQSLDPGEMLLPLIPPLIPPELVKVPTLPALDREKSAQAFLSKSQSSSHQERDGNGSHHQTGDFAPAATWSDTSNNFPSTTGFHFYDNNRENDLEPVLFTAPSSEPLRDTSKPPTGRKSSLNLPFMPSTTGGHDYQPPFSGKDRAMNTAGLIFEQRRSNPSSNQPSARLQPTAPQKPSYGNSPIVTGRGNAGNTINYASARRELSRQEEINMVRQLQ